MVYDIPWRKGDQEAGGLTLKLGKAVVSVDVEAPLPFLYGRFGGWGYLQAS